MIRFLATVVIIRFLTTVVSFFCHLSYHPSCRRNSHLCLCLFRLCLDRSVVVSVQEMAVVSVLALGVWSVLVCRHVLDQSVVVSVQEPVVTPNAKTDQTHNNHNNH